jgi:hypothetical protein
MERTRFIEHRGKRILLLDYSGVADPEEALREIAKSKAFIATQPPNSLLTLTHVRDARYNREIVTAMKGLAAHNKPFVRAGAVVGLAPLHRIVYQAVMKFSGRNLPAFDDMEEARDWLVEQPG